MLLKLKRDQDAPHNRRTFAMAKTAKATHLLQWQHFISKQLSKLMDLITSILDNDSVSRHCPIAHLIPRDTSAITYLDSSSHTAGGYSTDLQFWWHLQWPNSIQGCAAKASTQHTISINALEYAAIIINYVATTAATLSALQDHDPYPIALFFTDNVASEARICKGAKWSPAGKALGTLQCARVINNPVGINAECMYTINNVITDCISQFLNHNNPLPHFLNLSQDFPQLQQCRRFHPSVELVSMILDALLLAKSPDPREPNLQKLALPDSNIFLPSAAACTSTTYVPTSHNQCHRTTSLPATQSPSFKGKPSPAPPSDPALSQITSTQCMTFSLPAVSTHHTPAKPTLLTLSCAFRTMNQSLNAAT